MWKSLLPTDLLAVTASVPDMLFPYLYLVVLCFSGFLLLVHKLCQEVDDPIDPLAPGKRPALHQFALVILAIIGFIYAAPRAGFVLAAAALLLLLVRSLGGRWFTSVVLAVMVPTALYQLFVHQLGVPLPSGWLAW